MFFGTLPLGKQQVVKTTIFHKNPKKRKKFIDSKTTILFNDSNPKAEKNNFSVCCKLKILFLLSGIQNSNLMDQDLQIKFYTDFFRMQLQFFFAKENLNMTKF